MTAPRKPKNITPESIAKAAGEEPKTKDYFDAGSGRFLVLNQVGRWLPLAQADYKRYLRARGLHSKPVEGQLLSEIDEAILDVQNNRDVTYYGPVCGRFAGLLETNGHRILVTEDPRLPEPMPGNWDNLRVLIEGLLAHGEQEDIGRDQVETFHGWMKSGVEALRAGTQQQQQVLALCGPPGSGKSLLQSLITEMYAGRACKAERYFSGKTPFNADLYTAEHLILEDEHCSTRIDHRMRLGAAIKQHTVSTNLTSLHPKGRTAVNLPGWWRVSITLNDDPEAMMILPPLDQHIADKIILMRAGRFPFPLPMGTTTERSDAWRQFVAEIPAYLHWLRHEWEIPDRLRDPKRYNISTFHHPILAESLESLSPESELLELLDGCYREPLGSGLSVEATHSEIETALRAHESRRTDRLLSWRNACGSYLGKLAKKRPDRVQPRTNGAKRWWIILPDPS
jgi:hypothetical protein